MVRSHDVPQGPPWPRNLWGRALAGKPVLKTSFLSSHDSNDLQSIFPSRGRVSVDHRDDAGAVGALDDEELGSGADRALGFE